MNKKFDVVFAKGRVVFNEINVEAADAEGAVAAVRAKHGWMVERVVSVTEYVAPYLRK